MVGGLDLAQSVAASGVPMKCWQAAFTRLAVKASWGREKATACALLSLTSSNVKCLGLLSMNFCSMYAASLMVYDAELYARKSASRLSL